MSIAFFGHGGHRPCYHRYSPSEKEAIAAAAGYVCVECGKSVLNTDWDVDHKYPLACGWADHESCAEINDLSNLRPLHVACHQAMNARENPMSLCRKTHAQK